MTNSVLIPEMMLRFTCNQQGCCCKRWKINFDDDDLFRLLDVLDPEERSERLAGMSVRVDEETQTALNFRLATVGEDRSCQFLAGTSCGLQNKHGVEALPKICRAFPAHAQPGGQGLELHYDAVCPEVLEQLAEDDRPFQLVEADASPGTDLGWRALFQFPLPEIHIGSRGFPPEELWVIRKRILAEVTREGERGGAALDMLARVSYAIARLINEEQQIDDFEVREGEPVAPFEEFFEVCMRSHQPLLLGRAIYEYRRFIFALDLEGLEWDELYNHLEWRDDWRMKLDWREPEFQPLMLRFLGHRFFSSFDRLPEDRQLGFNYGTVTHGLATAMRYAVALADWTGRERVDMDTFKVALGASEFMYRAWRLFPAAMPWFGLKAESPEWIQQVPTLTEG
ncbi:MAG: hypothetical protein AAFX99_22505 [Myxococcota bacterium]